MEGKSLPHATIEEMAEYYVKLLLVAQPQGPYYLAGHSLGGQVAFAMSQILLARGHSIGLLAIVDTFAPGIITGSPNEKISDDTGLLLDIGQLLLQVHNQELTILREEIEDMSLVEQLSILAKRFEKINLFPEETGADYLRWLFNVYRTNISILQTG